ncbi:hypothetical protein EV426DRAFT_576638 [Tirmania nivea]|nr:hypothetical protein EV426DRAFT_576638 [Tirmania nivea]
MLNAFHARSILELGPKERVKIDSICAHSDKLLLGASSGNLRIYTVHSPDTADVSLSPPRIIEKFSRKPIDALACIKESSILISLSNSLISIHDLESFVLQQTLQKTSGALCFAVTTNIEKDDDTGIPSIVSRLAVGGKKRLLLYSWHDAEFRDGREISVGGNVRTITWASGGGKVVVGLGWGGFVMVDVHTGVAADIVPPAATANGVGPDGKPVAEAAAESGGGQWGWGMGGMGMGMGGWGMGGWGSKPLSTRLKGEELLLVKDKTTLFIDSKGNALPDKSSIPWPYAPDAIAYSYPYLVSLHQSQQHLEVRNPATQSLLQTIQLPGVTALHVPPPNVALVHAGKLFYVCSPTQVWRMGSVDYEAQVQELIKNGHLDEAISILEQLESVLVDGKEEKIREVQMLKAQSLFDKRQYRESMELFANVEAPPERVIRLFPKIIAGELSIVGEDKHKESDEGSIHEASGTESGETPENGGVEGGGTGTNGTASTEQLGEHPDDAQTASTGEAVVGEDSDKRANGIDAGPVISSLRKIVTDDTSSIRSKKLTDDDAASVRGSIRGGKAPLPPKVPPKKSTPSILDEKELRKAVNELTVYLGNSRLLLSKYIERLQAQQSQASLASTASAGAPPSPIKAPFGDSYFATRNASADSVVDKNQNGVDDRLEKAWATAKLVHTTLFRAYMYSKPTLVGSLVRQPNHCDPVVVNERLKETGRFHDLVDFFGGKKLHREALTLLKQFAEAPTEDPRAPSLHGPTRIIHYLQTLDSTHLPLIFEFAQHPLLISPTLAMEIFLTDSENAESLPRQKVLDYLQRLDRALAIRYLEHLINQLRDLTPDFHGRLISLYLEHIQKTDWLAENAGDEAVAKEKKDEWKERLLEFLRESRQYRSDRVLGLLPKDDPDFWEARAVVLSNMGRHREALEIYVFKLESPLKAEEYCVRVHASQSSTSSSTTPSKQASAIREKPQQQQHLNVFHILLEMYLAPQPPYPPTLQLDNALTILTRHGSRLDASQALALIPEDMQIQRLEGYFESRIRGANSEGSEGMIRAQLGKGVGWGLEEKLVGLRGRNVVVKEGRVCPLCHKRLGRSVVSVLPSGEVVHYGCGVQKRGGGGGSGGSGSGSGAEVGGGWRKF